MRIDCTRALLIWLVAAPVCALAPHELAVLVNQASPDSRQVANVYCALRGIPQRNQVLVAVPDTCLQPEAGISPEAFTDAIWTPATETLRRRGMESTIRAWVYSVDFPVRVTSQPEVSLQGITFVRNRLPPAEQINKGIYASPFFSGPSRVAGARRPTVSLDAWRIDDAPLPSMMLGHTGARGSTLPEVLAMLRRGVSADYTRPTGTVYFVERDDVRSRAREWQIPDVVYELGELGVAVESTPNFPNQEATVLGVMIGAPQLNPARPHTIVPGAFGEHLTSFGARFAHPTQTKLTAWLHAGYTASSGTVVEPYALWTKFPHSRFFVHYAHGATLMGSLYQSVHCPLQLLMVGEPLARPFAPRIDVDFTMTRSPDKGYRLRVVPATDEEEASLQMTVLMDGEVVVANHEQLEVTVPSDPAMDGVREIRVIVHATHAVRHWGWSEKEVAVGDRQLPLAEPSTGAHVPLSTVARLAVSAPPGASSLQLLRGTEVLSVADGDAATLELDPALAGLGPFRVHARALYPDGRTVRSSSIWLHGVLPDPPPLASIRAFPDSGDGMRLEPAWDGSPPPDTRWDWYQWCPPDMESVAQFRQEGFGELTMAEGSYTLSLDREKGDRAIVIPALLATYRTRPAELAADVVLTPGTILKGNRRIGGIAFNVRSLDAFDCFGYDLVQRTWIMARYEKGAWSVVSRRGRPLRPGQTMALRLHREGGNLVGRVNGERVCTWPGGELNKGKPAGILSTGPTVRFKTVKISPPILDGARWKEEDGVGVLHRPGKAIGQRLTLRADNGYTGRARDLLISEEFLAR